MEDLRVDAPPLPTPEERSADESQDESERLRKLAGEIATAAIVFLLLSLLVGFGAVYAGVSEEGWSIGALSFSGCAFSLSMVLFMLSNLVHIRAALEKLNGKK